MTDTKPEERRLIGPEPAVMYKADDSADDTIHYCKDCAEADTTLGAYRLWKCLASKYPNLVAGGSLFKTCEEMRAARTYGNIRDKVAGRCEHFKALEKSAADLQQEMMEAEAKARKGEADGKDSDSTGVV